MYQSKRVLMVGLILLSTLAVAVCADDDRIPIETRRYVIPIHQQGEDFNDPILVTELPFNSYGMTCGRVNDVSGYPECVSAPSTSPDVVYCYTAAGDEEITVTACNSNYDTRLFVFDASFTLIGCNEQSCEGTEGDLNGARLEGLALAGGATYYFTVDGENGECGQYSLTIQPTDNILAVELSSFDAIPGDGMVTIRWATSSETDNDYFDLTRDGQMIARVNGAGSSSTQHEYSWIDRDLLNGREYHYALYAVDVTGFREQIATANATPSHSPVISEYRLEQNYPNPFNPETSIAFHLIEAGHVELNVFDITGREVATVVSRRLPAGEHSVMFEGGNLPSGVYIYRLEAGSFSDQKKMVLMR